MPREHTLEFTIYPVPPFRLELTVNVLRRLPLNRIDRWDGHVYRRVLFVDGIPVEVSAVQYGTLESPELHVSAEPSGSERYRQSVNDVLVRSLGIDVDLTSFYTLASKDPELSALTNKFRGFKPTRTVDVFEALVNAISCQQLSLTVGLTLLNRLSAKYGKPHGNFHAFPGPEDLKNATTEDLRALGYSARKADYILGISRSILDGDFDPDRLIWMDDQQVISTLKSIRGIGRWTAEYVALRGLGRLDIYPADDVGSQNKLHQWLSLPEKPDYQAVHRIVDKWSPYRGLIYFYLLLNMLEQDGLLPPGPPHPSAAPE